MDSLDYDGMIIQLRYFQIYSMSTLIEFMIAPRLLLVLRLDLLASLKIMILRTSLEDHCQVWKICQILNLELGDVQSVRINILPYVYFKMLSFLLPFSNFIINTTAQNYV